MLNWLTGIPRTSAASSQSSDLIQGPRFNAVRSRKNNDAFFIGLNAHDHAPLLFDCDKSFHQAMYGPTGSGKTAFLAYSSERSVYAGNNVFGMDLKGLDYILFATLVDAAHKCGLDPPIHLTNRTGKATHYCPVMKSEWWMYRLSAERKADTLISALGLDDKQAHSWWSDAALEVLAFVAEQSDPEEIDTFVKLSKMIELRRKDLPKPVQKDSVHVAIQINRLARVDMFNPSDDCHPAALENALELQNLFRDDKQTTAFLSADTVRSPKISSVIARLLGRCTLLAANDLQEQRRAKLDMPIDEASFILGTGFLDVCLTLSRAKRISVSLGFQDIHALQLRGVDYSSLIDQNCDLQFCFGAKTPDAIRREVYLSGETREVTASRTYDYPGFPTLVRAPQEMGGGTSIKFLRSYSDTFSTQVVNRFKVNDVLRISADPQRFIFRATRNTNLCHLDGLPVEAKLIWHIPESEFIRRSKLEWPEPNERTVICGASSQRPRALPNNVPIPATGIPAGAERPRVINAPRRRR